MTATPYRVIVMQGERYVAVETPEVPVHLLEDLLAVLVDGDGVLWGFRAGSGQIETKADIDRIFATEGADATHD